MLVSAKSSVCLLQFIEHSGYAGHSGGLHSGHWLLMNASHVTISCKSGIVCPSAARYSGKHLAESVGNINCCGRVTVVGPQRPRSDVFAHPHRPAKEKAGLLAP